MEPTKSPEKTKKQLAKERKKANKARRVKEAADKAAKRQQKLMRKTSKAAAKKAQQEHAKKASQAGQGRQPMSKSQRRLALKKQRMSKWSVEDLEQHITSMIRKTAMECFKLTDNMDLVVRGLRVAQRTVEDEHARLDREANGPAEGQLRQTKIDEMPN